MGETFGVKLDDIPPAGAGAKFSGTPPRGNTGAVVAPGGGAVAGGGAMTGAPAGDP
jgi:hypothetical protein